MSQNNFLCQAFRPFKKTSPEKGMTIIEILIVIALIGTLMTIIMTNILDKGDEAKVDLAAISQKKLSDSLTLYRMHNGRYPSTEDGLAALLVAPLSAKKWKGPYTDEDKIIDPWNHAFTYEFSGGKDYKIISSGIDEEFGNEDDIVFPKEIGAHENMPTTIEMTLPPGQADVKAKSN